jgi:hypothetical protein
MPKRFLPTILALAVVVTALAGAPAGAAGVSKPKAQPVAQYAKTVCGTYQGLLTNLSTFSSAINGLDPRQTAAYLAAATSQVTTLVTATNSAKATLQSAYPNIPNGQKVGGLLASDTTLLVKLLTTAQSQLAAGGIDGPFKFVSTIQAQVALLSAGDPFSKVTDQKLLKAFLDEPACKTVVQISGGPSPAPAKTGRSK